MTVKRQAAVSVFWVGVASVVARVVSSLRMLVLAKLLMPADFGLVAIALLAIGALQLFHELGFSSALIYRQDDLEDAADTAFWVILGTSVPLFFVAYLAAEPLMQLFNKDAATVVQAVPVLRVLALSMIISSVGEVPTTLLMKDLRFRAKIVPELLGALSGAILAIVLALAKLGVWSLVAGYLVEAAVAAIVVYFLCPWRPRGRFHSRLAHEMFGYGKHIAGSRILVFGITDIDDVFVSKLLGSSALGFYSFAYKLSNLPATNITRLVNQVMFPAFSKMQEDREVLRDVYLRTTRYVSLLTIPASLCIMAFASDFIHGFYGDKWAPSIAPIQLLGIYGLARSIAANMGNVFKASGKPQWLTTIAAVRLSVMAALLYPATRYYGIVGVSVLSAAVAVVDFFVSMALTHRIVRHSSAAFLVMLSPILVNALLATAVAKLAFRYCGFLPLIARFLAAGALLGVVYGALVWITDSDVRGLARVAWREGWRLWRGRASRGPRERKAF